MKQNMTIRLEAKILDRLRKLKHATGIPISRMLTEGVLEKISWEEKKLKEKMKNGSRKN